MILLIHGWGMNSQVWADIGKVLEQNHTVGYVDLPGHGDSANLSLDSLEQMADMLAAEMPQSLAIVGWSLGGLIAQALAKRHAGLCRKLVLIASTVCFRQRNDWQAAMPQDVMDRFQQSLESDYEKTVKQFLALQFIGTKNSKQFSRQFQEDILNFPPNPQALRQGMQLLLDTDLRPYELACEMTWLFGAKDRIVPIAAAQEIQRIYPQSEIKIFKDAGHAPFISEPEAVLSILKEELQ